MPQVSPLRPGIPLICILPPQPTIQQHHFAPNNVVAKPESPRAKPVLAFSRRNSLQLLDRICVALVVRVKRGTPIPFSNCFSTHSFSRRENTKIAQGKTLGQRFPSTPPSRRAGAKLAPRHCTSIPARCILYHPLKIPEDGATLRCDLNVTHEI